MLTRSGPGVDRGRRVETASPTGQAILNPVPSHDTPDVCHLIVDLNWDTLDNLLTNYSL